MMKGSTSKQLLSLVNTLDREEKSGVLQYLRSPAHNQREELLELMTILLDSRSSKDKVESSMERLFASAAQSKTVAWRLMNSDLLRHLENYLMTRHPRRSTEVSQLLDLRHLLTNRNQLQRVKAVGRRLTKLKSTLSEGVTRARIDYQLDWEELSEKLSSRRISAEAANRVRQNHERSCLLEALQLACESLSARTIDNGELAPGMLPLYLDYLEQGKLLKKDRVIALYYYCYRTLERLENEAAFLQLRQRLSDLELLGEREATDILFMAINACIRRVNNSRPEFGEVALDLYDLGLEKAYLLDDQGALSRFTYSNIVALALKANNPERARHFIERYSSLLPPDYAQSSEALNRARLSYHEGALEAAMDWIQTAKDQDILTTLNIRILQMRVYHQLGEFRLLDAHLDALDMYLRRRKDSLDYHYKAYRLLLKYVQKYRRLNPYDREALAAFRVSVVEAVGLPERNWLLRIVDEG